MRKALSLLLALAMIFSVFSIALITASAVTVLDNVDFTASTKIRAGESLKSVILLQKSGSGGFLIRPNWTISRTTYNVNGGDFSFFGPTVTAGEQYSVIFFVQPEEGYTFSPTGTYKLNGATLTKKEIAGSASVLRDNEYGLVEQDGIYYLCLRVGYKMVIFDEEPYAAFLRGYSHTIEGNLEKGHLASCTYSTMTGGGGLTVDKKENTITLPKALFDATGANVLVHPKYEKHTFSALTVTSQPTAEDEGEAYRICSVCEYNQTLRIPKKEEVHMYFDAPKEGDAIPAAPEITFSVPGYRAVSVKWFDVTEAGNVAEATGTFKGGRSYQLAVEIAADHNYDISTFSYLSVFIADAFSGSAPYTDANYGTVFKADHTFAVEHSWDEGTVDREPTCTVPGEMVFTCTGCDAVKTEPIPVTEHTYKKVITKATLTKDGQSVPTCTVCGETQTAVTIRKASKVSISKTKFVYNAKVQKPTLTVKNSAGKAIKSKYYTVKWSNASSKAVGKYTVTVTFKGIYSGKKVLTYTIVPKAVTGVKKAASTTKSVKLTWTKATGAKYYSVFGSTDGKTFKRIAVVSTNTYNVTKVNGKALAAGKTYYFKVRAMDGTKKLIGAFSAVLKTGTKTAAPGITKLTSAKSKSATVTWGKVTGAKSYVVYKSADNKTWTKAGTATGTSFTLSNLTGGKRIYVKVLAVNAYKANSAYSAVKYVTVKK